MPQQHSQFEEEFRDGPQPHVSYQETSLEQPSMSYTTPAVPPMQLHVNIPAQKLQVPAHQSQRQLAPGSGFGARVVLAIFSMLFILVLFIIAIVATTSYEVPPNAWLAVVLALIFAGVALWINIIVNRRH